MEKKTYVIKIKKTADNGEKYFVNQTYVCKDKLTKYEEKMARYRKNCQRRAKERALCESQFITIEEEVKLPYEVVTTKPRADHGKKTDCVFKWSEAALAMKKMLSDMKTVQVVRTWGSLDDPKVSITYRHPKLSDLTFKQQEPIATLTKEQYKELQQKEKTIKAVNMENREFSEFHNKLINCAYSTENQALKKAAQTAAHESKIQKLMKFLREKKLARYKYRLEFRKLKGTEPTVFITNYSNKPIKYLKDVMDRLAAKLVTKINDFISINIYDNKTNQLLELSTGFKADDVHYKTKLLNEKALKPEYYAAA